MKLLLLVALACLCLGVQAQSRSFCDRYTDALFGADASLSATNQTAFLRDVLTRAHGGCSTGTDQMFICSAELAFDGILSPNSPILDVFQGRVPYKPNPEDFTVHTAVNGSIIPNPAYPLIETLLPLFGNALGCSAPGFPVYPTHINQARIHDGMRITQEDFSFFNSRITASMRSFGVSEKDITYIVKPFLTSFGACSSQPICQDPSCELGTVVVDANCKARYDLALTQVYDVEGDRRKWTISFVPAMVNLIVVGLMLYVLYGMLQPRASDYKQTSSGRK